MILFNENIVRIQCQDPTGACRLVYHVPGDNKPEDLTGCPYCGCKEWDFADLPGQSRVQSKTKKTQTA